MAARPDPHCLGRIRLEQLFPIARVAMQRLAPVLQLVVERGVCREILRLRGLADAPEVESIRVEADADRRVVREACVGVAGARSDQQTEALGRELEVAAL